MDESLPRGTEQKQKSFAQEYMESDEAKRYIAAREYLSKKHARYFGVRGILLSLVQSYAPSFYHKRYRKKEIEEENRLGISLGT